MYDEILRIPLVIAHPDIEAGVSKGLVSLLDLGPTLAELGGTSMDDVSGRSFAPLLYGECTDHRSLVFAEYLTNLDTFGGAPEYPIFMVRGKQYKYAETVGQGSVLYKLDEKPAEVNNLVGNPAYAPIERALRNQTEQLRPTYL
jgi:arylsulfatase A-like enzyme